MLAWAWLLGYFAWLLEHGYFRCYCQALQGYFLHLLQALPYLLEAAMFVWAHIWFDFDQSQGVEAFVEGEETVLAAAQGSWASQSAIFALFLKFVVHDSCLCL